jgi:hypothetical protein
MLYTILASLVVISLAHLGVVECITQLALYFTMQHIATRRSDSIALDAKHRSIVQVYLREYISWLFVAPDDTPESTVVTPIRHRQCSFLKLTS